MAARDCTCVWCRPEWRRRLLRRKPEVAGAGQGAAGAAAGRGWCSDSTTRWVTIRAIRSIRANWVRCSSAAPDPGRWSTTSRDSKRSFRPDWRVPSTRGTATKSFRGFRAEAGPPESGWSTGHLAALSSAIRCVPVGRADTIPPCWDSAERECSAAVVRVPDCFRIAATATGGRSKLRRLPEPADAPEEEAEWATDSARRCSAYPTASTGSSGGHKSIPHRKEQTDGSPEAAELCKAEEAERWRWAEALPSSTCADRTAAGRNLQEEPWPAEEAESSAPAEERVAVNLRFRRKHPLAVVRLRASTAPPGRWLPTGPMSAHCFRSDWSSWSGCCGTGRRCGCRIRIRRTSCFRSRRCCWRRNSAGYSVSGSASRWCSAGFGQL